MAKLFPDDIFLVNRNSKSGKTFFSQLKNSILDDTITVSPNVPTEDLVDGQIWIDNTQPLGVIYLYNSNQDEWVELKLSGNSFVVAEIRPEPYDHLQGDLWYQASTNTLRINSDPNGANDPPNSDPWIDIIPSSLGGLPNVHYTADYAAEGSILYTRRVDDTDDLSDTEWYPTPLDTTATLAGLNDVYLEPDVIPEDGDSLVYRDDVLGDGTTSGWTAVPLNKPSIDVVVSEQTPGGTSRYTSAVFDVGVTIDQFSTTLFKVKAFVNGQINRSNGTRVETDKMWLDITGSKQEVNGIVDQEPAWQTLPAPGETKNHEFELKFPAKFTTSIGNGKTPDESLSPGTTMTVMVQATKLSDNSEFSGTSDPFTPQEPDVVEDREMHGLRFHKDRATYLSSSVSAVSSAYTYSAWIKRTPAKDFRLIATKASGKNYEILIQSSGKFYVNPNSSSAFTTTETLPNDSKWHHIVFSVSGGNMNEVYFDGNKATIKNNSMGKILQDGDIFIGRDSQDKTSSDGYLSDVYFVDGQAVGPTAFANRDTGKWTPLDPDIVKSNIEGSMENPYDRRPNMDEKWSDGIVDDSRDGHIRAHGFDGDLTTYYQSKKGGEATLNFSPAISGLIRMYMPATEQVVVTHAGGSTTVNLTAASWKWDDIGDFTDVTQLKLTRTDTSKYISWAVVEVDGRILVDGPANNSRVWSEQYTGIPDEPSSDYGPQFAFDGYLPDKYNSHGDGKQWSFPKANSALTFTFNGLDDVNTVKVWYTAIKRSGADPQLKVNGVSQPITLDNDYNKGVGRFVTVDVSGTGLKSIEYNHPKDNQSFVGVSGVLVDEVILVDGTGQPWDSSQRWTDSYTTLPPVSYSGGSFNGETMCGWDVCTLNNDLTWNVPAQFQTEELEISIISDQNKPETTMFSTNLLPQARTDTGELIGPSPCNTKAILYKHTLAVGTEYVTFTTTNNNTNTGFVSVMVNGELLVDPGTFGPNGFFLPFDPEAEGANYSSGVFRNPIKGTATYDPAAATSQTDFGGGSPEFVFDGNTSTTVIASNDGKGRDWIYIKGLNLSSVTSLRLWMRDSASVKIDGNDVTTTPSAISGPDTYQWKTVNSPPASVDIIAIQGNLNNAASRNGACGGIEINGQMLVDHSSIGHDDSGQDNHFYDKNFGVGNTSHHWSTGLSGGVGTNDANKNPETAFNGRMETASDGYRGAASTPIILDVDGKGLNGEVKIATTGVSLSFNINDGEATGTLVPSSSPPAAFVSTGFTGEVKSIEIEDTVNYNVYAYMVGDQILINNNTSDLVKDSPMTDYAVIEGRPEIHNGALSYDISGDSFGAVSGNATISFTNTKIYFENTHGDTDTMTGVSQPPVNNNNYPGSSSTAIAYSGYMDGVYYQGARKEYKFADGSKFAAKRGDVIGCAVDGQAQKITWYLNGAAGPTLDTNLTGELIPVVRSYRGKMSHVNFGQQPFTNPNVTDNDDGTVTIDGEVYNKLFVGEGGNLPMGVMSADNAYDVNRFYAISDDYDNFIADRDARIATLKAARQSAITKLTSQGLTESEILMITNTL